MRFFDKYPYTNFHELNLDWVINRIRQLEESITEFEALQKLQWAGEWDIQKAYQQWALVQDGGNGYVAILPVPRNVQITNTDYWRKVADYDALYAAFEQRISDLETTVGDASDGLVKDVDDLKTTVGDNSSGLVKDVDDLKHFHLPKKFLFLGDSYDTDNNSKWVDNTAACLGLDPSDYYNIAQTGTSFYDGSWLTLLQAWVTANPDIAETITDFIICGGVSDSQYTFDFDLLKTQITDFVEYAKEHLPNAEIYLGYIGYASEFSPVLVNRNRSGRIKACAVYTQVAGELNIHYLNGVEYVLHNMSLMHTDLLHPNSDGGEMLGRYIAAAYKTGSCDVKYAIKSATLTLAHGTFITTPNIWQTLNNNMVECFMHGIGIAGINQPMSDSTVLELGTLNLPYTYEIEQQAIPVVCHVGSSWYNGMAQLTCFNGSLYITIRIISGGTWVSGTLADLIIPNTSFIIHTMNS